MIAIQTLAKMMVPALTVSIHIYVRVPWDLVEATVKTVSKISSIVVSSFVQLWYSKILYKNKLQWEAMVKTMGRDDFS